MNLAKQLFEVGAVQFGNFILKSGIQSPIYVDIRRIISYPHLLRAVIEKLVQATVDIPCDLLCGVPYAAIPLATGVSLSCALPMIMPRKGVKDHGTKRAIEGVFSAGQLALIIEDVVTSGASILETVAKLKEAQLHVQDVLVVIDRQQGASQKLAREGIFVHALYTLSDITDALFAQGIIDDATIKNVSDFIQDNQIG